MSYRYLSVQLISVHLIFNEYRQCDALIPLEIVFLCCRLKLIKMRRRLCYFVRNQREKHCNSYPLVCVALKPGGVQDRTPALPSDCSYYQKCWLHLARK